MELYLIRHGIAAERGIYPTDEERPLTNEGKKKTTLVAQRLYQLGLHLDQILTSPLVRAEQTAAILLETGITDQVEVFPDLAPEGSVSTWLEWYEQARSLERVGLVGHQPDLSHWAEILIGGEAQGKLILKKAGIIGLNLPQGDPVGNSQLFLLTSPRWLLQL